MYDMYDMFFCRSFCRGVNDLGTLGRVERVEWWARPGGSCHDFWDDFDAHKGPETQRRRLSEVKIFLSGSIDFQKSRKVASATWVYLRKHIVGRVTLPDLTLGYYIGKMMFGGGGGALLQRLGSPLVRPPFLGVWKTMVFLGKPLFYLGQNLGFPR